MNESIPLHWSYDYNHGSQKPEFAKELLTLLQEYDDKSELTSEHAKDSHTRHVYQILPNFWRGYIGRKKPEESWGIGSVIIDRYKDRENIWNYSIQYQNYANGEDLRMQFGCRDECFRCLDDSWQVSASNSGQDSYSNLEWKGFISEDYELKININNTEIMIGKVDNSLPLTCNWSLFDVMPALADSLIIDGNSIELSLLDDLEQYRPNCRIGYLESTQTPLTLNGFYLCGTGVLPSYWWVDKKGNIAVVSNVFETFVLREYTNSKL